MRNSRLLWVCLKALRRNLLHFIMFEDVLRCLSHHLKDLIICNLQEKHPTRFSHSTLQNLKIPREQLPSVKRN